MDDIESGLRPKKKLHGVTVNLEIVCLFLYTLIVFVFNVNWTFESTFFDSFNVVCQLTGTALSAAKRMQFNLEVKPIPQVEMMKNMPNVVLPMFWIDESVYLDKDMTDNLKNSMFLYVHMVSFMIYLSFNTLLKKFLFISKHKILRPKWIESHKLEYHINFHWLSIFPTCLAGKNMHLTWWAQYYTLY